METDHTRPTLPLHGYDLNRLAAKFVDPLSDEDMAKLNELLPWSCFTADSHGRRFGNAAWGGKRDRPQVIPDKRIVHLNKLCSLQEKHVLEIGCFEGIHTIALCQLAAHVTAVDGRIENVVKTIVRCAFFGFTPTAFKCDVEQHPLNLDLLTADVAHHVGVLYHLRDPVRHLLNLGSFIRQAVMLDTHFCTDAEATATYEVKGKPYRYKQYGEFGDRDAFSGMYDHSKWLRLDDIIALLRMSGFNKVEIVETRTERNGPRALLIARRT